MISSESNRPIRVAIACPGIGLVQRGYERMFLDMFDLLKDDLDLTLFKGGGRSTEREKVVPLFLPRNGRFLKLLPIHRLVGRTTIHAECMTFALALLPYLRDGAFDVVHCADPPLARILYKLRRLFGMRFRLLFTHASSMPPTHYQPADHVQEVSKVTYDDSLAAAIPAQALTLLPLGVYPARFETTRTREDLRREYGVSDDTFVILDVAALDRRHKRIHHLIEEAARLQGNFLLWLDGSPDQGDPSLPGLARSLLGDRVRITHVPTARIGELYRMADVMAHAALWEAFGLAIVEGASTGLPVLVHDAPHFRWLFANPKAWVDMTAPGALADRLSFLMAHREALAEVRCTADVRARLSWDVLKDGYRAMYERVAALELPERGGARRNYYYQLHG
jgi:glycosyltransferase involved in cell wall biosynthesis